MKFKKSKLIADWHEATVQFSPSDVEKLKAASKRSKLSVDTIIELAIMNFLYQEDLSLQQKGLSHIQKIAVERARAEAEFNRTIYGSPHYSVTD